MESSISKKQAVKDALEHRERFPVPYFLNFSPGIAVRLKRYFQAADLERDLGNYLIWTQVTPVIPEDLASDSYTDIFGVTWGNVGATRGYPVRHPLSEPTLRNYHFPEPCPDEKLEKLRQTLSTNEDLFCLVNLGDFFERANFMRGMKEFMTDMYKHPDFVDELMNGILGYNLEVMDRLSGLSIDGLSLSDDYGHQGGLLLSPSLWRRFIKPHLKTMFRKIRERGWYVFLHSDGAISPLLPELIEVGIHALHPVQSEVMDLQYMKTHFGDRITIFGGVGTQSTLIRERPDVLKDKVRAVCRTLGKGGGLIITPGIQMHDDTPLENAVAFVQAVRTQ